MRYTCRTDDDGECLFELSVIIIFGFPQKNDGPCVPGTTLQGRCNRFCIECCIEQYMVDACSEDLDYLRKYWKARVKKSHCNADKYNQKKKKEGG